MKRLCIYHGNCADGFGAAWVVKRRYGDDVEFHAGVYQDPPPDVTGLDVIIVDFSYKRDVILEMAKKAKTMLIIDHHKSAIDDLFTVGTDGAGEYDTCPITCVFDVTHSGAMLTWMYYFCSQKAPKLLEHIEDRDLWKFELKGTREIQAALFSYPYDFEIWDQFMTKNGPTRLRNEGIAIERKHFKDIDELLKVCIRRMNIAGHNVPVANLPYIFSSDAGHAMGIGEPFAACYMDTPGGRVFSLRSSENGVDVSEVAKKYGGGGHKHAAGFRVKIGWEGDE